MLERIKYWLLRNLLADICLKSDCEKCALCDKIRIDFNDGKYMYEGPACHEDDIFRQAREVWGLNKE